MKKFSERNIEKIMKLLENQRGQEPKTELILHNYQELNDIVKEFITIFNSHFEKYNNNLYNNLRDLHIVINRSPSNDYEGEYSDIENTIYLSIPRNEEYEVNEQVKDTLFHELLHVASNNYIKKYSGFDHRLNIFGAKRMGRGINEGFTEYLLLNYFSKHDTSTFYNDEMRIIKEIENIVGKEKMIEYYFNGNLYDLIKDLSKDNDFASTIYLLKDIDYLVIRNKEEVINNVKKRGR